MPESSDRTIEVDVGKDMFHKLNLAMGNKLSVSLTDDRIISFC